MRFTLTILSLLLTLTLSAQVKYSTTKTVWNFRTSNVDGRKPVSADFAVTNGRAYNTADSLIWGTVNNVITPLYTYYPYSETNPIVLPTTVTSTARYTTPKYQKYIRTSTIAGNIPLLSDFTSPTIMCINFTDSCVYELIRGVITKTYTIYPYSATPPTCTYTYSAWGVCQPNGTQTRTVLSSTPSGCTGTPVLTRSCAYSTNQFYVSTSGSDYSGSGSRDKPYKTIKGGLAKLSYGDTLNVLAGTYTSSVFAINTGISLVGVSADSVIVNMTFNNDNIQMYSSTVTNGNQIISGITFNGNMTGFSCIDTFRRSNVTIRDCKFLNFIDHAVFFRDNAGTAPTITGNKFINDTVINCSRFSGWPGAVWLTGQKNFEISGNYIESVGRSGDNMGFCLKLSHVENGVINNNELKVINHNDQLQSAFAIECNNVYGNIEISGNTIQGLIDLAGENVIKGSHDYSVYIHDNVIGHPTLTSYRQQGIYLEGRTEISDVRIENNTIKHVANAIRFTPLGSNITQRITIDHNTIYGIGTLGTSGVGYAIYHGNVAPLAQIKDVSITNNIFDAAYSGTQVTAISLPYGCTVRNWNVEHNIIQGFENAPVITSGVNLTGMIDNLLLSHNIIYQCGNSNLPKWWGIVPTNYVIENTSNSDPLFTDSENEDYSFKEGSEGINGASDGSNIGKN